MITPEVVGQSHYQGERVLPFTIGVVDPGKPFVHVFDDVALDFVLDTLDTISDFVGYLRKREQLLISGRLLGAAGEEDLLTLYLRNLNETGEHDFVLPKATSQVVLTPGMWEHFERSPERLSQIDADRISYNWDRMVDRFSLNILNGTWSDNLPMTVTDREIAVRFMARETRFDRRQLSKAFVGLIDKTPEDRPLTLCKRVVVPTQSGRPYYAFLLFSGPENTPVESVRTARLSMLEMLCMIVKLRFPDAKDIIGYAKQPGQSLEQGEDVVYLDARNWTAEDQAEATRCQVETGILTSMITRHFHDDEYPLNRQMVRKLRTKAAQPRPSGSFRNSPCWCGSGKKLKRCHAP